MTFALYSFRVAKWEGECHGENDVEQKSNYLKEMLNLDGIP